MKNKKSLEELQEEILKKWEEIDDEKATEIVVGWLGWDFLSDAFRDSIMNYDDVEVLENLLKELECER